MKLKLVISTVLYLVCANAIAYDGWSGVKQIKSIRNYPDGGVLIQMIGAANPSGCASLDYILLPKDDGSEGRKKQYSALLSAYMARETVTLALTGCSGEGTSGYRVIEQVWLTR